MKFFFVGLVTIIKFYGVSVPNVLKSSGYRPAASQTPPKRYNLDRLVLNSPSFLMWK
jgi:hypothetical protein